IRTNTLRNEKRCVGRQINIYLRRLLHQDSHPRLQLRRLYRNSEAPAKARFESLFQSVYLLWVAIASKDHLLTAFKKGIKRVEELLLRSILFRKKLNVVYQQGIDGSIVALEISDGIQLKR